MICPRCGPLARSLDASYAREVRLQRELAGARERCPACAAVQTANDALCEEIRRLKAELHQEREANRPLRHAAEQLATLRAALRVYADARAAYAEGLGTASARMTEEERAYYECAQRVAALIEEPT